MVLSFALFQLCSKTNIEDAISVVLCVLLSIVYCFLSTVYFLLSTVYFLLSTFYLSNVSCLLSTVSCLLSTDQCTVYCIFHLQTIALHCIALHCRHDVHFIPKGLLSNHGLLFREKGHVKKHDIMVL